MDNTAKNPEEAVVSVWTGKPNVGTFIGTAFFISPLLLLTAKHVVRDTETNILFPDIYLGLVAGRQEVKVAPNNIHCCDDYDVAVIKLDEPDKKQAFCRLSLQANDYRNEAIDCYAINKANNSRDSLIDYKVGIIDQNHNAYRFDHSAAKGFSGGAVTLHKQHYVIGILSSRVKNEQETLFIPLYKCKTWLNAINQKLNDRYLEAYLNPAAPSQFDVSVSPSSSQKLPHYLNELALFIGRPYGAYDHILRYLLCDAKPIKACFCLFTSKEDLPEDFAKALGIRLEMRAKNLHEHNLLDSKRGGYLKKDLSENNVNPWDCDTPDEFFINCLKNISSILKLSSDKLKPNPSNYQEYCEILHKHIIIRKKPIVFISYSTSKAVGGLLPFIGDKSIINKIQQRKLWIEQFNQLWQDAQLQVGGGQSSVALIFCLRVPKRIAEKSQSCFRLKKISDQCFSQWIGEVNNLLDDYSYLIDGDITEQLRVFKEKFEKIHGKKVGDLMSYQRFIQHTKTITKQMASQ